MTYHFVNLISWYDVKNLSSASVVQADSLSLVFIARLFGYRLTKMSGVAFSNRLSFVSNEIVLSAKDGSWGSARVEVLPFFSPSLDDLNVKQISEAIKEYSNVYIGVSSPKQDYLAKALQKIYPEKHFFCLGAALYVDFADDTHNWLRFLRLQPKRTIIKIAMTFQEVIKLIFIRRLRREFREFLEQLSDGLTQRT